MRFGLFYTLRFPEPWSREGEYKCLWEIIEQITYAEEMGFEGLWLTEHHFIPAWSMCAAPEVILSAVSQRTSKIRLGIAVVMSPLHHPLHTAVKAATLDLRSNGRVDLGLGRSSGPYQLRPFGVRLEDTREMTNEALSIIPRMWTEEEFFHKGKFYDIPPLSVVPKPFQEPHPPLWVACSQEETSRIAGEMGVGCLMHGQGGPAKVAGYVKTYKEAIQHANPVGKFVNDQVVADVLTYCDENDLRAREQGAKWIADDVIPDRNRRVKYWEGVSEEDVPSDYLNHFHSAQRRLARDSTDVTPENLLDREGGYCMGDPDACIEVVERYEAAGVEEVVVKLQISPATTHKDAMQTLRLFGKYVVPHFKNKEKRSLLAVQEVGADN